MNTKLKLGGMVLALVAGVTALSMTLPAGAQSSDDCDPNYSGCVPIATDVDCEGGEGDGPAYVQGPVEVIGEDIYGLDNDGDGIGCDDGSGSTTTTTATTTTTSLGGATGADAGDRMSDAPPAQPVVENPTFTG